MFKIGQKEVTAKDFYKKRQITNIATIDVNKVVVSDKVSCNNGKDFRFIGLLSRWGTDATVYPNT